MKLKNILNKLVFLLSVFSLFWIIAGSVVEFHQKHVFYKHVDLWNAITCKTIKDEKKITQFADKDTQLNLDCGACHSESVYKTKLHTTLSGLELLFTEYHYDLISTQYRPDLVFRGPPMA